MPIMLCCMSRPSERKLTSRVGHFALAQRYSFFEAYLADPQAIERGVTPTWALSGVLAKAGKSTNGATNGDAMDVDDDEKIEVQEEVERRTILLVAAADLEGESAVISAFGQADPSGDASAKTALFLSTPHKHVYALSPIAPPTLSSLASYALTNISAAAQAKWKPAPAAKEGGYGGIVHLDGERKKKGKGKAKAAPVTAPARTNSSTSVASTSASTSSKPAAKTAAPSASTSKSKASTSTSKASTSTSKPAARPIGTLGGLFAKQAAAPKVEKKVPAKRKASPPPKSKTVTKAVPAPKAAPAKKAGRSNGIFGDEELASDEDFDMDGDDFDEEAMREMEEAERQAKEQGKAKASRSTTPAEKVQKEDTSGLSAKEKKAKEKQDLNVS